MKIGIICAFGEEGQKILQTMDITNVIQRMKTYFYEGKFLGHNAVTVICGIGKVSAALCTQALIDTFKVDVVIFAGIAGCVNPELKIGDTVIAAEAMYHDVDRGVEGVDEDTPYTYFRKRFKPDEEMLLKLKAHYAEKTYPVPPILKQLRGPDGGEQVKIVFGRVLTGDQFITRRTKVRDLHTAYQGDCVEMEGAAVAHTCALNEKPFLLIRTISDLADEDAVQIIPKSMEAVLGLNYQILLETIATIKSGR